MVLHPEYRKGEEDEDPCKGLTYRMHEIHNNNNNNYKIFVVKSLLFPYFNETFNCILIVMLDVAKLYQNCLDNHNLKQLFAITLILIFSNVLHFFPLHCPYSNNFT